MFARRLALAVATFFILLPAQAATVEERSPFHQGHWWDPTRSGHGFELFNAADQVAAVWYTYDTSGQPTWYYAQGPRAALGSDMPLMRLRWENGRVASPVIAGTLRLNVRHAESIEAAWTLDGHAGRWVIQPFTAAGVTSEVDHSGHWFDPANNGWGFTLTEQGDVLGAVLYAYAPSGVSTWIAGFGRDAAAKRVDMYATQGHCPYCPARPIESRAVGRLSFEYRGEASLVVSNETTASFANGVRIHQANAHQLGRPASTRPADRQLASFHSAEALTEYLRSGMYRIFAARAGADFSAAPPPGPAFSATNLQERDVDESALVATNGRFIYTFAHESGKRAPTLRIAEVSDDGASFALRGAHGLAQDGASSAAAAGLFLEGSTLVAITGSAPAVDVAPTLPSTAWAGGHTQVEILDASGEGTVATRWRARLDGHLIASRRIGDRLFVVLRHVPRVTGFTYGLGPTASNAAALAATSLASFMPKVRIDGGPAQGALGFASFHLPPQGMRAPTADMTLFYEIDLATPRLAGALAVAGPVETVYASARNIYIASTRFDLRTSTGTLAPDGAGNALTDIHRISLAEGGMAVSDSGTVEGFLATSLALAQFRLSEHDGRLRVVTSTTSADWWGGDVRNRLTILEPSGVTPGVLKTVSFLPNRDRPQLLGLPLETLYATRFVEDRLYAITYGPSRPAPMVFVDPLYVVDLGNAADPRILGELVIPGFSEYLHPLGNGLLLGLGRDTTLDGTELGLKVSLFDVNNDALPSELSTIPVGGPTTRSALLRHHHAFSALSTPDGNTTFAFPARLVVRGDTFGALNWAQSGLMRMRVTGAGSGARLESLPSLITHRNTGPFLASTDDDAALDARSVLLPRGTVYVAHGSFWHQGDAGTVTGPR